MSITSDGEARIEELCKRIQEARSAESVALLARELNDLLEKLHPDGAKKPDFKSDGKM
jgi:hypothetical protein